VIGGLEVGESETAWDDLGVDCVTGFRVGFEHLARYLRIAGFVGADEAKLVAAKGRNQAIEEKEAADQDEEYELARGDCLGVVPQTTKES